MKRQRAVFIKGAAERGVKESVASEIFDLMEKFAGYGFNKSHAAAYSYVAYQTAYLKAHFTAPFMAANLCMVMDDGEKMHALAKDARENGITMLMPDVNRSEWFFTVPDEQHILYGLGAIKGVNQNVVASIIETRREKGPFIDIFDFAARVKGLNSKLLGAFVKAGALDSIDPKRGKLFANVEQALSAAQSLRESEGQESLFAAPGEEDRIVSWIEAPDWSPRRRLVEEKAVMGFWLTGHMFDQYREELEHFAKRPLLYLKPGRESVKAAGVVTSIRQVQGKRGRMGIVSIEDGTAVADLLFFSETWERYRQHFQVDDPVCATGRVRYDDFSKRMSLTVDECYSLDEYRRLAARHLCVELSPSATKKDLSAIHQVVDAATADDGLSLVFAVRGSKTQGRLVSSHAVKGVEALRHALRAMPGVANATVEY